MESAVMTSALISSQSAVGYQQMKRSERDEATSCWRFSRWFERAVARISRCYLEIAIAKRCRLHKLIRQHFALALKIQQEDFALIIQQSQEPVARTSRKIPAGSICLIPAGQPDASNSSIQSRAYLNQLLLYNQSRATVSSRRKSRRKNR
ncbi:hypothetical protein F511_16471 [Dorcoceras hygrometricum]|uniref:Uncharacterized protein n=1 Tax=Dorcoceras hygrometricum TaxID=472368 RepID=A0A2Z7D7S5_9LAMI|nr:hypothetical protein F511_16471 [Dorcoceras hygrometricum]